jgi:Xaa-Pro aminopeptidase
MGLEHRRIPQYSPAMLQNTKFQSFSVSSDPAQGPPRLAALREELKRRGLSGFFVPRSDEFQGEYVPPRAERLSWLTGFTGSAGACVVTIDKAAVFVDGRYTTQANEQVDTRSFQIESLIDNPPPVWIGVNLAKGARFGYDPWLHTAQGAEQINAAVAAAGGEAVSCDTNPLDAVWTDQPTAPLGKIVTHPLEYSGENSEAKRMRIGKSLSETKADTVLLTLPESIAWLLNVRGADVPHTPFPLSFASVARDGHVTWFVDRRKLTPGIEAWIGNAVTIRELGDIGPHIDHLGQMKSRVQSDPATASAWIFDRLKAAGAPIVRASDPCALPKACKNSVEVQGFRNAHERDGAAIARFLCWLDEEAPGGDVDEISACRQLETIRAENSTLKDLSFDSISASGPHAALPHYRVNTKSNRKIQRNEIFLIDSGGQYPDGTTDITRTVIIGEPAQEMRDRFTRVLKGHIALATILFPDGTTGAHLDVLARQPLWMGGFDFDHGTGHGVGSYLSVHEGPQNISKRMIAVPLKPGMVCSNEPGFYKPGHFGIRIENLIVVTEPKPVKGGERPMMQFETITLAPIDRRLIDAAMLTAAERDWLDAYHQRVLRIIGPLVDAKTRTWLTAACALL